MISFFTDHVISQNADDAVSMNSNFQRAFRECITQTFPEHEEEEDTEMDISPEDPESSKKKKKRKAPTLQELEQFSKERWESVLLYMVGTSSMDESNEKPTFLKSIEKLLDWSHLVQIDPETKRTHITTEGFQFLLRETRTQVWKLLKQYLDSAESRKQIKSEILQFLFELSFMKVGRGYKYEGVLTPTQTVMLLDISELGIVQLKHPLFYPTPMATGITQGSSDSTGRVSMLDDVMAQGASSLEDSHSGHIIVETNYRVYAYTRSSLQIALLSLFVSLEYRLPNMVVGQITRDSAREAFKNGITADQILGYLYLHAHPQMRQKRPVIPETVSDQIRLWEQERNRLAHFDAVLYEKFPNPDKFFLVVSYSKQIAVHLWSSEDKMVLVVRREGHDAMKQFISQNT